MRKEKHYNSADLRERKILIGFIIAACALLLLWVLLTIMKYGFSEPVRERTNPEQAGTPRVYDYADMLTEDQEASLEKAIAEVEEEIAGDIVIVIENQSFEELYGAVYDSEDEDSAYDCIRHYANSFWDEGGFGWNAPGDTGNGIIMVDNVYRESNGYVYNWVAGSGDMRHKVGDSTCQELSEAFTNRLPSTKGQDDLALQYTDVYFEALMTFVGDCGKFGELIRGTEGWAAFSPSGIARNIGSSFIYIIILIAIVVVLFIARQNAIRAADPDLVKGGSKIGSIGSSSKLSVKKEALISWAVTGVVILVTLVTDNTWSWVLLFFLVIWNVVRGAGKRKKRKQNMEEVNDMNKDKEKKTESEGVEKSQKKKGFSMKEALQPKDFDYTRTEDTFVRTYTTSVTHSSGSSGGGGGHSGGGSHR